MPIDPKTKKILDNRLASGEIEKGEYRTLIEELTSEEEPPTLVSDDHDSENSLEARVEEELKAEKLKITLSKLAHRELRNCPSCGSAVSRDATACTECGCNFYARYVRIFLTIVLPVLIAACLALWVLADYVYRANPNPGILIFVILAGGFAALYCVRKQM